MYLRRSVNKIVKVRPLLSSIRLCRYSHIGCGLISKFDEMRCAKSSTTKRNFCSEKFKENDKNIEKIIQKPRTVGIDATAPNLRNNYLMLKSTTKTRKETGGKFHTMSQKSLTLKKCRQPSKSLWTSQFKYNDFEQHKEKIEKKKETETAVPKSKTEICFAICGSNPSLSTSEANELETLSNSKPVRVIDQLTDAEIEEICRMRCKTRECCMHETINSSHSALNAESLHGSPKTNQSTEKLEGSSTTNQSAEKLETAAPLDSSTATIPLAEKSETLSTAIQSTEKLEGSPTTNQSAEKLETETALDSSTTIIPLAEKSETLSTAIQSADMLKASSSTIKSIEYSQYSPPIIQSPELLDKFAIDKKDRISGPKSVIKSMTSIENRKERKNRSVNRNVHMQNMISTKVTNMNSFQRFIPLNQHWNSPQHKRFELSVANPIIEKCYVSRPKQVTEFGVMHPMSPLPLRALNHSKPNDEKMMRSQQSKHVSFAYRQTHERNVQAKMSQELQSQVRRNANPCTGYGRNGCHFEQLKPVPFRFRPIYDKNFHSEPVVKNQSSMYVGAPFKAYNQTKWQKRLNNQQMSAVFGSQSSKNRQTFVEANLPKLNPPKTSPNPMETSDKILNNNNVVADIAKVNHLPMSELSSNVNKREELVKLRVNDIEQQSRNIMKKLVENLSVVIERPGKLKLVTSAYPQLRDDKDVIIEMQYVNITDVDARHFSTGKYNSYSYATTVVGRSGSGKIIEAGRNVHNVKPGDKVFVKPVSCGKCSLCSTDRRDICEYVTVSEMSPMQGVLSRLHVHSSEFVTKIPDNVSLLNGAMSRTLSTAIRACQKSDVSAGDVILVIGGGTLGTATGLAAQSMGATTVCLADTRKPFLEEARKLGIDKVFHIDSTSPSKNTAIKIGEQIGDYPRLTFDCRGSQLTNQIAIDVTKTGGKVVVMTNTENDVPLPFSNLVTRDIDVIISTYGTDETDIAALRLLSTNKMFFSSDMYKHYDLSNVEEAFRYLHSPDRLDAQIIVECGCKCLGNNAEQKKSDGKNRETEI